jgi:hypothetical protein
MSSAYPSKVLRSIANWLERASRRTRSLNIGIYGYTHAGKTLFLYNFLRYLDEQKQLAEPNEKCRRFLDMVGKEIEQHGRPGRTSESWEGISFVWKFSYSPKETRQYRIEVHDLFGEELDKEASEGYPSSGQLASMVRQCDAFLFFFNPTQKQDRYSNEDHLTLELERAESLLEALLEGRGPALRNGPGMRPVIFVITAKDLWQTNPEQRDLSRLFREKIADLIKDKWPQAPDRLVDPRRTVREVANPPCRQHIPSEQGRQLTATVRTLFELDDFARKLRLRPLQVLIVVLFVGLFLWFLVTRLAAEDPDIERVLKELQPWAEGREFPREQKEQTRLGELLRDGCVLAARPNKRAEQLRQQLNEIGRRLQNDLRTINLLDLEGRNRKLEGLNRILAQARPSASMEELRQAQRHFWDKLRDTIVADLNDPKKVDSRKDAIKLLREERDKLERYQVPGKERLANELNQAITFLESPKEPYQVVFEPTLEYSGPDENTRYFGHGLVFGKRDQNPWWLEPDKKGKYQRLPEMGPVTETFQWDQEITVSIYAYNFVKQKWEYTNVTWDLSQSNNKLPPSSLYHIGAPFLGCEGQAIILKSEYYKLTLLVKETKFAGVIPDILKRPAK